MNFTLDASLLKDGINNVSVIDTTGHVYAQRTFFAYPKDFTTAEFKFDKTQYDSHDKVDCRIYQNKVAGQSAWKHHRVQPARMAIAGENVPAKIRSRRERHKGLQNEGYPLLESLFRNI